MDASKTSNHKSGGKSNKGNVSSVSSSNNNQNSNQEQIISGFNQLRQEQRSLASKAAELEMELNEHNLVIETLRQVDGDRKCYRMVGGVLVERQAKDVLPALTTNQDQLGKLIQSLNQQIASKGQEINEYREKHNIRIRGQEENSEPCPVGGAPQKASSGTSSSSSDSPSSGGGAGEKSQGVLVDNKS